MQARQTISEAWKSGSTREWRVIREAVLERDGRRCQIKAEKCTTVATTVHHTVPRRVAGDDPAMLVAACVWCNGHVGDPSRHDPAPKPSSWW